MTRDCKHGQLARSCELCAGEQEITELRAALAERDAEISAARTAMQQALEALKIADKFCGSHTSDECPDSVHITIQDSLTELTKALEQMK